MLRFLGITGNAISKSINGATAGKRQPLMFRSPASGDRGTGADGLNPSNSGLRFAFPHYLVFSGATVVFEEPSGAGWGLTLRA
jgi:hypothetical protein